MFLTTPYILCSDYTTSNLCFSMLLLYLPVILYLVVRVLHSKNESYHPFLTAKVTYIACFADFWLRWSYDIKALMFDFGDNIIEVDTDLLYIFQIIRNLHQRVCFVFLCCPI